MCGSLNGVLGTCTDVNAGPFVWPEKKEGATTKAHVDEELGLRIHIGYEPL